MDALEKKVPIEYRTGFDGRLSSLIASLTKNGFDKAVLCQIATKPDQYSPILSWSRAIQSGELGTTSMEKIIPLPSIHPSDPERSKHISEIAASGFKGIKLHPYYQGFVLDSSDIIDLAKEIRDNGLFLLTHTGYDIGFPKEDLCSPRKVMNLIEAVPNLRIMISHFGGWMDWQKAEEILIGAPVDIEISMAIGYTDKDTIVRMLKKHSQKRLYFGSDWPWSDYDKTLPFIGSLNLNDTFKKGLMGENAARFLGLM